MTGDAVPASWRLGAGKGPSGGMPSFPSSAGEGCTGMHRDACATQRGQGGRWAAQGRGRFCGILGSQAQPLILYPFCGGMGPSPRAESSRAASERPAAGMGRQTWMSGSVLRLLCTSGKGPQIRLSSEPGVGVGHLLSRTRYKRVPPPGPSVRASAGGREHLSCRCLGLEPRPAEVWGQGSVAPCALSSVPWE